MKDSKHNIEKRESVDITVDGHKVKISFANEHNPGVAKLVKDALIDSFIRRSKTGRRTEPT